MSEAARPRFDAPFLKAVMTRLILEPHFVVKFRQYLKPAYFKSGDENGALEAIAILWFGKILDGETETNFNSLYAWLQMQPDGDMRTQTLDMFDWLSTDKGNLALAKSDHMFQTFLQWLKSAAFLSEYGTVKEAFNSGQYDDAYASLEGTLGKIKNIALDNVENADWDNAAEFLAAEATKTCNKFELGIEDFDEKGGFEEQTLNLFVAATNGGKSMLSVHLMVECVKQGKHGYFVFVEDRKSTILRRVFANLTNTPIDQFKTNTSDPVLQKAIADAKAKLKKYVTTEFMYGVSPDFVLERAKEHMARRRAAGEPDLEVMCVDYLQHIAQFSPGEKAYEKLANSMARYKDFALKYKLTMFTHQQVNRSGVQEQNKDNLITLGELSTSFNAAFVCDTIMSLNRSPEQKERQEAVFYVLKGREGAAERRYQVKTNFACAQYLMSDYMRLDSMTS
jgi:replicative DNA helicase